MKRQLLAPVNPLPFGEDAEEAADVVDDLPGIVRGQGLPGASFEQTSCSLQERFVDGASTRKQIGLGIALNAVLLEAPRRLHRFCPEHIRIGTRVAEIPSAPNGRYVRLCFLFYSVQVPKMAPSPKRTLPVCLSRPSRSAAIAWYRLQSA